VTRHVELQHDRLHGVFVAGTPVRRGPGGASTGEHRRDEGPADEESKAPHWTNLTRCKRQLPIRAAAARRGLVLAARM
jgi:hypothetical protein